MIWLAASAAAVLGAVPSAQDRRAIDSAERASVEIDSASTVALVLEGFVLGPDGSPAEGAVVVSSAGGRAVTDVAGNYRLEVEVPRKTTSVQVTAVGRAGDDLAASASVAVSSATRRTGVVPLALSRSSCSPSWVPTFGGEPGTDGVILATAVYDDGSESALYVGGRFASAGGLAASRIAKWDGSSWAALGSGMSPVESSTEVRALAVYDDGGGPALYAGGSFTSAGGVAANSIAKWDGSSWTALGSGISGFVSALAVFDDGGGPALYAGGSFTSAGGVTANRIAKWDGSSWAALGSGLDEGVSSLAAYDDGAGPALYAGGFFGIAGGTSAKRVAKWDGSTWTALGTGMPDSEDEVFVLAAFDDGAGPALYVGGDFRGAGGLSASGLAKWNGSSWAVLSESGDHQDFSALAVHDDGTGPALYAGGGFDDVGGVQANSIARWDGSSWAALGSGTGGGVAALAVYDDGRGPALYAAGSFRRAGDVAASRIARWDGSTWSAFGGSGRNGAVGAGAVFDDGRGPALHVAVDSMPGFHGDGILKRNGSSWTALGNEIIGGYPPYVRALAVHDDGGGPALYAGGAFGRLDALMVTGIAKWDGSSWTALGSGLSLGSIVDAMTVYDDGRGPALYAGGEFTGAGGIAANRIARWDGSSWTPLASGIAGTSVLALSVYDDGAGPALYAAGSFTTAGGVPANNLAKWDGMSWTALAGGTNDRVLALSVYDDGAGSGLYAGGRFTLAGGMATNRIAKWDGTSWTPLGSGLSSAVRALVVFDGPERGGPALIAGGDFGSAFDSGDSYLARWQSCPDRTAPILSCPTSVTVPDPLSGPPGETVTFTVTASDDRDASPSVVCVPPSGSFFPPGKTLVQCKATDGARNQASCSFEVLVQRK